MTEKFKNFNLTLEDIKTERLINDLVNHLEKLNVEDPLSPRAEFLVKQIDALEQRLDQIRENTLIRFK
ncbi:MAG: hypothetical protein HKN34_00135 [Gammaproteobacteria bacterium]|nr:hypothetical protein [Gammaproteobacteria bacterium]